MGVLDSHPQLPVCGIQPVTQAIFISHSDWPVAPLGLLCIVIEQTNYFGLGFTILI